MKNIREVVADNLIALRKQKGLTQIELAQQINYSDKAISRWEKSEVLPDLETLEKISEIYDIPLSYLLEEHTKDKPINDNNKQNKLAVEALSICAVLFLVILTFVYLRMMYNIVFWQAFVWGVPLCTGVAIFFERKWNHSRLTQIILSSILVWTFLTAIYVQFQSSYLWLIYFIGIPIQAGIIVASYIKRN